MGAGQPQRAEKSGWIALCLGESVMLAFALFLAIWPDLLSRIFTSDLSLIAVLAPYLRIVALACVFYGLAYIIENCIVGAGDTLFPFILSLISVWVIQVPLSIFLSRIDTINIFGVRWAIAAGTILSAVVLVIYFRTGRWKKKRV